jgi:hypothetical protein
MTTSERFISDAKRAARRLARVSASTYQECLDQVARESDRANWGAFLADPVDVRAERVAIDAKPELPNVDPRFVVQDPGPPLAQPPGSNGIVMGLEMDGTPVSSGNEAIVLCFGPPMTGKSLGVVAATIEDSSEASIVVHEPHPSILAAIIGGKMRGHARTVLMSPLDEGPNWLNRISFNPLHPRFRLRGETTLGHATRVASVLLPSRDGDYFTSLATRSMAGFMCLLMERPDIIPADGRPGHRIASLPAVLEWMTAMSRSGLSEGLRQAAALCDGVASLQGARDRILPLVDMPNKERSGVLGTVDQGLLVTKSADVRRHLDPARADDGAEALDALEDAFRATTVVVTTPARFRPAVANLSALAIDCLGRWQAERKAGGRQMRILIDEASSLRPVPWIREIMRQGAPRETCLLIVDDRLDAHALRNGWLGSSVEAGMRVDHVIDHSLADVPAERSIVSSLIGRDVPSIRLPGRSGMVVHHSEKTSRIIQKAQTTRDRA